MPKTSRICGTGQSQESSDNPGWPVLDAGFGRGGPWGRHEEWLESARRFVTVSSEFYPDLQDYYEAFVEEWFSERGLL